jgi:hypothetical protein
VDHFAFLDPEPKYFSIPSLDGVPVTKMFKSKRVEKEDDYETFICYHICSPVGSLFFKKIRKIQVWKSVNGSRIRNPRKVFFSLAATRAWLLNIPNVFQTLHVSYSPGRLGQVSV